MPAKPVEQVFEEIKAVTKDILEQGKDLPYPATVADIGTLGNTDPASQNITGQGSWGVSGYDRETFTPLLALQSSTLLTSFDMRTNSEVAFGYTKNSCYNALANGYARFSHTYYPIGDPLIMVTVNSNGEDPFGDYWKCDHGAYAASSGYTDEELETVDFTVHDSSKRFKNVIIVSEDGVRYCMPFMHANRESSHTRTVLNLWTRRELGVDYGAYAGAGNMTYGPQRGQFPNGYIYDPSRDAYVDLETSRFSGMGNPRQRILVFDSMEDQVNNSDGVVSIQVPIPATVIDEIVIDENSGRTAVNSMAFYKEERLKGLYKTRSGPRENEYQVQYNVLEKEGLKNRFGQFRSLSETLNGMYIGLASFLAKTFIETVYTFKKVEAPRLTPLSIKPANLALAAANVTVEAQPALGSGFATTGGYYPQDYTDRYSGEQYRAPEAPEGGFIATEYFYAMNEFLTSQADLTATDAISEYGGAKDDFDASDAGTFDFGGGGGGTGGGGGGMGGMGGGGAGGPGGGYGGY